LPLTIKSELSEGFTIMEVALAATVLALTLVGMIGVVELGTQMLDLSRKQTIANQILHSEITQLRLQSWPVISGYPVGNNLPAVDSFSPATQVGYTGSNFPVSTPGNGYPAGPTALTAANDPSFAMFVAQYPPTATIFALTRTVACIQPAQANPNPFAYGLPPLLLQVTFTITWTGVTGQKYTRVSSTYVGMNSLSVAYQKS
jgi:hypothetical protein